MKKNTNRHAYLIIAHNQFYILEKLLLLLDDERNDIYIHIDKKVKDFDFEKYSKMLKKSHVYFTERISVFWGDYSLIQASMILLKTATKRNYSYYHFISGVDLPIKTQSYIHQFFEDNNGKQFVHFNADEIIKKQSERDKFYYLFQQQAGRTTNFAKTLQRIAVKIQKIVGINRQKNNNIIFKSGAQWVSITDEFSKYLIKNENLIRKLYKKTFCCDEVFIQSMLINSKFADDLYLNEKDNYLACMRYIDWKRGDPYTFKINDFEDLTSCDYLFARKFDINKDKEIVDKIYSYISEKQN